MIDLATPWLAWCVESPENVIVISVDDGFDSVLRVIAGLYSGKTICPISKNATKREREEIITTLGNAGKVALMPEEAPAHRNALPRDPFSFLVFTSGTSGKPKGVVLAWKNIVASARSFQKEHQLSDDDSWLLALPLHHISGLSILFRALVLGHEVVLGMNKSQDIFEKIREGVSGVSLVPTQLKRILEQSEGVGSRLGPVKILVGGAPLFTGLREKAAAMGLSISESYGATETAAQILNNGVPLQGVEIVLSDDGEILVRGDMVAVRHVTEAGVLPVCDRDGFWHSGDLGAYSADGRIEVIGRRKELIISGGVKISPVEVEGAILSHPSVQIAAAIGVADPHWGERLVALVVATGVDESEIMAHLKSMLSPPKVPKEIHFVKRIPVSSTGKVNRALLAEQFFVRLQ